MFKIVEDSNQSSTFCISKLKLNALTDDAAWTLQKDCLNIENKTHWINSKLV